jgi:hypothetical protein
VILITAKTAATTPITPPTIAPILPFRFPCDGEFVVPGGPEAFIVCAGTLRKYPSQERHKMEVPLCTNFRANGAYIAPSAGLICITTTLVGIPDIISQLTHLLSP